MKLDSQDLADLAVGAAFLGTGGGGDPYIGRVMVQRCLDEGLAVELVDPDALADDAFVIPTAMMGAPTVLVEKVPSGEEAIHSLKRLERRLGRRATHTMPIEIGGINSTIPLLVGAQTGLPLVDADGMGRAFPQLEMETFNVYGVKAAPIAMADEKGNVALVETETAAKGEFLARGICIRMGGQASLVNYPMDGATAKRVSVPATMTLAQDIGRVVREARAAKAEPLAALVAFLGTTHYGHAEKIGAGKVVDIARKVENGWSVGIVTIAPFDGAEPWRIRIQNENLVVERGTEVVAVVPDLICVLDGDTAEAIPTERLRYGQRVDILGIRVPPIMRSPEALEVFGPKAFGLAAQYSPLGLNPAA
ncbi:DUF917 domain-containing protein [Pseudogemmobacter sonorensis]|uniref:DUF917 domain-containing protein n=1 Tax=Pseudogemmobacter sonorensis TaxID=2989681 RepID=UPI0036AC0D72